MKEFFHFVNNVWGASYNQNTTVNIQSSQPSSPRSPVVSSILRKKKSAMDRFNTREDDKHSLVESMGKCHITVENANEAVFSLCSKNLIDSSVFGDITKLSTLKFKENISKFISEKFSYVMRG